MSAMPSATDSPAIPFTLSRNPLGRLVLTTASGEAHEGVIPVRAFPIGAPDNGFSLMDTDGHELAWINRLADLPETTRQLLEEELASREFVPEIRRIIGVNSYATPCEWQIETDRGATEFTLKGEEDIRRLAGSTLLIADSHGIHYLIRNLTTLDRTSRKILDRFL